MAIYVDRAPHVAGSIITLTVLAYVMFALRMYTRLRKAAWGVDDWFMAAASAPFAVLSASCITAAFNGVGVHKTSLVGPNAKYEELGLKWFFMFEVFYCVTIIPIKLSIAFQLIRIAQGRKLFIYSQYVVSAMFTIMNIIAAFYIIFQCSPVSYAWDTKQKGSCNSPMILTDIYYATTAVNIATDWFCAFMPIPLLWNVKLNRNAKISVAAILSLGIFASLSACIRLKYTVNLQNSTDYLYGVSDIMIWGYAENAIGMIVGCVSTLRPLFRKVFKLGSSDSDPTPKYALSGDRFGSQFPGNGRRTYDKFDSTASGHELETGVGSGGANSAASHHGGAPDKFGGVTTHQTQIHGGNGRSPSFSSDSDSQKQILDQSGGIMVHQQVEISRN